MKTPLVFNPVYKDNVWGGERIAALYHRENAPKPCGESWEISGHPDGPGVVASGQYAGRTLADLAEEFGADLVGTACPNPKVFPLLFKVIDANDSLSVQVHPDNKSAKTIGGEPKSERIVVVKTPVASFNPPAADTGVTVKYALYWRAAGSDTWTQYGDFMDAPTFGVDIVTDITDAETYWKIEAVFTASSVTTTETSGASEESQESGN